MAKRGGNEGGGSFGSGAMKAFPWFGAALILALLGGVTYFATGLLMPGRPEFPQSTGAATKSFLAEANKRSDLIRKKWEETGQDCPVSRDFAALRMSTVFLFPRRWFTFPKTQNRSNPWTER